MNLKCISLVTIIALSMSDERNLRTNLGGASNIDWFNKLLARAEFQFVVDHLARKVHAAQVHITSDELGCKAVSVTDEHQRFVMDKCIRNRLAEIDPQLEKDVPIRVNAHHIALLEAAAKIPTYSSPPPPPNFAKNSHAEVHRFVGSHLCHRKSCTNPSHIVWEPAWYNRWRDNCAGGRFCPHIPSCLRPHRDVDKLDWHDLVDRQ